MRRRLATVFVDIAGSTELVVRHPPETALGVVQCFMELVARIALSHHGHVKDFEGDGVMLYFDSVRDATEAALAIRAALDAERCHDGCDGGPGAAARISITAGEVALGAIGAAADQALAIVGPSVNLGARLLRTLGPGGIVASEDVVATLAREAPALAGRFRLLESEYSVPGAAGMTVAVYATAVPRVRMRS